MFTASIARDELTPRMVLLAARFGPAGTFRFLLNWGNQTATKSKRNARAKGGRKFWRAIAQSIRVSEASASSIQVAAYHVAAAMKQFGGDISAPGRGPGSKNAEALSIPISAESEGTAPSEWSGKDLFVLPGKGAFAGILGYSDGTGADRTFHALFLLRKAVTMKADKWWPEEREISGLGMILADRMLAA